MNPKSKARFGCLLRPQANHGKNTNFLAEALNWNMLSVSHQLMLVLYQVPTHIWTPPHHQGSSAARNSSSNRKVWNVMQLQHWIFHTYKHRQNLTFWIRFLQTKPSSNFCCFYFSCCFYFLKFNRHALTKLNKMQSEMADFASDDTSWWSFTKQHCLTSDWWHHLANWTKHTHCLSFWPISCIIWKHDVIHETGST